MDQPQMVNRACADCGESFEPWNNWKHPGSAGCRCHPCYLAYTRDRMTPGAYRRRKPLLTHGAKPTGARWRRLQEQVWASETHCGLCGGYVDQTLASNEKMARSVDHVIPISRGGAMYERENVRLAHRSCNSKAGNQLAALERVRLLYAAIWLDQHLNARAA